MLASEDNAEAYAELSGYGLKRKSILSRQLLAGRM